MLSACLTHVPV